MTQRWHQHVAWFSERYLGQAGLCFPCPASIWWAGDWYCTAGLVQVQFPVILPQCTLCGLQTTGFLSILGNNRDWLPELPLHAVLPKLHISQITATLSVEALWRHRDSHTNRSLLLLEELNHHLEWYSLSGHRSPGAYTAIPVLTIKKINYHEPTSLH